MPKKKKRIVIIGATSAMAEHCARLWLTEAPADLTLVARDREKTERLATDLSVRNPAAEIRIRQIDFLDPEAIQALADELAGAAPVDIVLIAHGLLPEQDVCEQNLAEGLNAIAINGMSPVLFVEAFAGHMQRAGRGTIAVIGSVAGDRGRKSNYVYGAAKGLVERYVQGMQHRLTGSGLAVILVKPGPTETPMTAHLAGKGPRMAKVEDVAKDIVTGIKKGKPVIYTPAKWALIMLIIRHLPRFVFNKMNI